MADAVIEIVARGEYIINGERLVGVLIHQSARKVAVRLALPIGVDFLQTRLCLLGDIEGIRLSRSDGIEFRFKPLVRILGKNLTAARSDAVRADDKFVIANDDRNIF